MEQSEKLLMLESYIFNFLFQISNDFLQILSRFSADVQHILSRFSVDSQQILIRFSADSQQILSRFSADSHQILSRFSAESLQNLSRISVESQQNIGRISVDSRNSVLSLLSWSWYSVREDNLEIVSPLVWIQLAINWVGKKTRIEASRFFSTAVNLSQWFGRGVSTT